MESNSFRCSKSLSHYLPKESIFIKLCEDKDDIKQANHLLYSILHDIDQRNDIVQAYIFGFEK